VVSLHEKDGVLHWKDIAFVPSIHGRVAFAREVRRVFLAGRYPTVAVELPESLAEQTLEGIAHLPVIHTVSYEEGNGSRCFFPLDPCDSVIEALRLGTRENCDLEFIDVEVEEFQRVEMVLPDSYAVNSIGLPNFYATVEPVLPTPPPGSQDDIREIEMARQLWKILKRDRRRLPVLCVLGMAHLRGVVSHLEKAEISGADAFEGSGPLGLPPFNVGLDPISSGSLYHILGELPYTTHLYEEERRSITLDDFEAVDKMKELLLQARERYHRKHTQEYERISLTSFQNMLQLIRNLCLLQKRLTPTLYEMAVAARGMVGSEFAIAVIETAKNYPSSDDSQDTHSVEMTEDVMKFGEDVFPAKKRYVDEAKEWKKLKLEAPPPPDQVKQWQTAWNPNASCSWTPEDVLIENFAGHVRGRALLESGIAQEHLEEFSTSLKDGIHVRETIRNLHLGKIIVRETPPVRGQVGAVVIIYEPPDETKFPWKLTWLPEFEWESVLAFYATDPTAELVGPGIARSTYGGQLFLQPRRLIRDIWDDPQFQEARDDAERLHFAAAALSPERFVACVSATPPTRRVKDYALRRGKRIIYLPLASFSRSTLEKLRRFHVLNGKPVRSYARQFIR
jgi:hypothetical protein